MTIFITTANGMFGMRTLEYLAGTEWNVRAMVRREPRFPADAANIEVVRGDLDRPETLPSLLEGVDRIFLSSPMHPRLAEREIGLLKIAAEAGVRHVVKIYGAVRHDLDQLDQQNVRVIEFLKSSGLAWTLVSPNSVMETSLLPMAASIREEGIIYGMSAQGRIGLVALDDVARTVARVLTTDGHFDRNYEITGPDALTLFDVAETFSDVLGRKIIYKDFEEHAFAALIQEATGIPGERLEMEILCHLRAWREGKASLVTDTYARLTGDSPTTLADWISSNRNAFDTVCG